MAGSKDKGKDGKPESGNKTFKKSKVDKRREWQEAAARAANNLPPASYVHRRSG